MSTTNVVSAPTVPAARPVRLHLGCGPNKMAGWINVDLEPTYQPDVVHDLRHGLPLDPATVDLIYSEHVLEHLDLATGMRILGDARRALKPGGVLRIAMPDLGYVVERYLNDWRDQQWLQDPGFAWIDTPARMLNTCVREWGHLYLYDAAELTLRLSQVGFATTRQCEWSRSDVPELRGLETRPDSLLVFEAVA